MAFYLSSTRVAKRVRASSCPGSMSILTSDNIWLFPLTKIKQQSNDERSKHTGRQSIFYKVFYFDITFEPSLKSIMFCLDIMHHSISFSLKFQKNVSCEELITLQKGESTNSLFILGKSYSDLCYYLLMLSS